MKTYTVVSFLLIMFWIHDSYQLENLIDTTMHKCIECLCHARTGCYNRLNCASYSIDYNYWKKAGSPTLQIGAPENDASYKACMRDENCVLNTIKLYTDSFQKPQCDCNAEFDCRDRLMLHLKGENCLTRIDHRYRMRYNSCAGRNDLPPIQADPNKCRPEAS